MERRLNCVIFPEGGVFIARCLDVEVASDGVTRQEAVANLKEALELYFEGRQGALAELPRRTYQLGEISMRPSSSQ